MIKRSIICLASVLLIFLHTNITAKAASTIHIAVNKANIRSEPSNTANIVAKASRNEQFQVLQEKFGWYKVQLPSGGTGWIAGYIVDNGGQSIGMTKKGKITTDNVHVRSNPSLSSNIIGKLHKGDPVTVTGENNGWANVTYSNQSAWISKQFIQFGGAAQANKNEPSGTGGFAYISNDQTNLRAGADTSAPVITKGSAGERYPIVGQEGDWYKITTASGREAYVASWLVSSNKNTSSTGEPAAQSTNQTSGLSGKTIVLDAGHGGNDPGSTNQIGVSEKQLTMQTAKRLQQKLSAAGANVILTRSDDQYVNLDSRASAANNNNADAFISIHYDSAANPEANGVTAYYHHGYQYDLASSVNEVLNSSLSLNNKGTRFGNYHVIRDNSRPATLLELGYLSNPHEGQYIVTDSYQELVSNSIYNGLQSYFK
ncbi:N-acetylmuramoyl-L-alanine amidase [Siminovitchia terrae]|uniref:N-acetylmuramoyl-L-alanine amidase n=1 Tax=Siminovitchia terrae TaxID=1914933 RepID=A0ABQ4KTW7_SIMTE|nr:N-acetylmuramoyl-L-alanine amidase [Siminovitchia terrae]GIN95435.1 N-acetylmuramoyl-L-alanine amidase [Siminovitchia terrae]